MSGVQITDSQADMAESALPALWQCVEDGEFRRAAIAAFRKPCAKRERARSGGLLREKIYSNGLYCFLLPYAASGWFTTPVKRTWEPPSRVCPLRTNTNG